MNGTYTIADFSCFSVQNSADNKYISEFYLLKYTRRTLCPPAFVTRKVKKKYKERLLHYISGFLSEFKNGSRNLLKLSGEF